MKDEEIRSGVRENCGGVAVKEASCCCVADARGGDGSEHGASKAVGYMDDQLAAILDGVDLGPRTIERARDNARLGAHRNVESRLGEIENLPLRYEEVKKAVRERHANVVHWGLAAGIPLPWPV